MKKITFLGDIMIEPPVLKAAKRKGGKYDFTEVFQYVKPIFDNSDYDFDQSVAYIVKFIAEKTGVTEIEK